MQLTTCPYCGWGLTVDQLEKSKVCPRCRNDLAKWRQRAPYKVWAAFVVLIAVAVVLYSRGESWSKLSDLEKGMYVSLFGVPLVWLLVWVVADRIVKTDFRIAGWSPGFFIGLVLSFVFLASPFWGYFQQLLVSLLP